MSIDGGRKICGSRVAAILAVACLTVSSSVALAQEPNRMQMAPSAPAHGAPPRSVQPPSAVQPPPSAPPNDGDTVFHKLGRWLDQSIADINANFKDARGKLDKFNQDADAFAKSTASGAKETIDAVARIPNARAVGGHERCANAPNGAPDCVAAANTICKAKGFSSGKSLDMTTAEKCPTRVLLGRQGSPAECTTETFVSRALCQ